MFKGQLPQNGPGRFSRIIISFVGFVALLTGLVYVGFVAKFQPAKITRFSRASGGEASPQKPVFYKSVGTTAKQSQDGANSANAVPPPDKFTLEIKVVNRREEAEKTVDMLASIGIQAYYQPLNKGGQVIYRIRRGVFDSEKVAIAAADELRNSKKLNVRVVKLQ